MATATSLGGKAIDWTGRVTLNPEKDQFVARGKTTALVGDAPAATDGYDKVVITLTGEFKCDKCTDTAKESCKTICPTTLIDDWDVDDLTLSRFLQLNLTKAPEGSEGTSSFDTEDNFRNRVTDNFFNITEVRAIGTKKEAEQANGLKNKAFTDYAEPVEIVGEHGATLNISERPWKWSESPFVAGMEDGKLTVEFMPGVNPNGGGNTNIAATGTTAPTAANSNRIYIWTDLVRDEDGAVLKASNLVGLDNANADASVNRAKTKSVQAPNIRTITGVASVTFTDLPKEFFHNADYADQDFEKDSDEYIPEFATEIYMVVLGASTGANNTQGKEFAIREGLFGGTAKNPSGENWIDGNGKTIQNGLFGALLTIDGEAIPGEPCPDCGEEGCEGECQITPPTIAIIDDVNEILNENGEIDLEDCLQKLQWFVS